MLKIDLKKIKRILVVRPGAIGDILLTTPFIRALKKALPASEIDYLCEPMGLQILQGNPNLNRIVVFEKNRLKKAPFFVKIKDTLDFYIALRKNRYDVVFDLFGNTRTAIMSFATGAKYRAGFTFRGRKYLYNIKVKPAKEPRYNVFYHTQLLEPFGIKPDGEKLDFFTTPTDEKFALDFVSVIKPPVIVLNPAGTWVTKRWPEENFAQLADMIIENLPTASIILLWGPGERSMVEKILATMKAGKDRVLTAPATTIKQMGALLKRTDAVIGNDGAGKHIAVAVGAKTITIFGPTNYVSWNPKNDARAIAVASGIDCAPCDKTECTHISCMKQVSPEKIFLELLKLLEINV
ncbi:MAG: glycosyltransferase family 9 protein [bacterium]